MHARSWPRRLLGGLSVFLACSMVGWPAGARGAEGPDLRSREAIEEIIRDYLRAHPEVVEEALQVMDARRREAEKRRSREAVRVNRDQIVGDAASPVGGNPQGDVTIVEFFDYACGYCRGVAPDLKRLLEEDRSVRMVYKEFPILGPNSDLAARAALAAHMQGKYLAFHEALMAASGSLTLRAILALAGAADLDVVQLQADMEKPEIRAALDRNRALAAVLGINGTPAFIVGTELVPGAVGLHGLKALVSQARAR